MIETKVKMKQKLMSFIKKQVPSSSEARDEDEKAVFILMHNSLHIGSLELKDGFWYFEYSILFKQASKKGIALGEEEESVISPLFTFPEIDKKYKSKILWPFFEARIPGLKQPEVQAAMKSENIKGTDLVGLLTKFGQKTIINPYELIPA